MNMRLIKVIMIFCVLLTSVCLGEGFRRLENTDEYTVKIFSSYAEITRVSDNEVRLIKGILFGDPPMMKYLPKKVFSPDGSSVLLPMKDFSYWIISLDDYYKDSDFAVIKLTGGGSKGRSYDRTPLFWYIEELLPDGLLKGRVANGRDSMLVFRASVEKQIIYAADIGIQKALILRSEDIDGSSETPFVYEVKK